MNAGDSADAGCAGFAPPPFQPEVALQQLQRALRDLKLNERQGGFEVRGRRVAELRVEGATLQARLARRLALTPVWDSSVVRDSAGQRQWLVEVKKRLARWDTED